MSVKAKVEVRKGDKAPRQSPREIAEAFIAEQKVFGGRGGTGATVQTLHTYRVLLLDSSYAWAAPKPDGAGGSFVKGEIEDYLTRRRGSGISEATWAKVVRHLRAFCKWAAEKFDFENPIADIRASAKETVKWIPTPQDVEALFNACSGPDFYNRRLRAMLALYTGSGLRRNEVLGARIEDVNPQTLTIKVTRKGGNQAEVPISPSAAQAIRQYLAVRPGWQKEDWLITDPEGVRIRDDYATRLIRNLMKKAGLKPCGPHSLRRYAATETARQSGDLQYVKELLGHSTLTMTLRYAKMSGVTLRQKHRRFDPIGHLRSNGEEPQERGVAQKPPQRTHESVRRGRPFVSL